MRLFPFFGEMNAVIQVLVFILIVVLIAHVIRDAVARPKKTSSASPNEREILQQLWTQMDRMEKRLENLETILMDKQERRK
jgi:phage shock protein B